MALPHGLRSGHPPLRSHQSPSPTVSAHRPGRFLYLSWYALTFVAHTARRRGPCPLAAQAGRPPARSIENTGGVEQQQGRAPLGTMIDSLSGAESAGKRPPSGTSYGRVGW
jgi:hypothetical protein